MIDSISGRSNYDTPIPFESRVNLHQQFSINPIGWHRWMREQLKLEAGQTIVELGCGTGDLWSSAEKAELDGIQLYLFDKSVAMLESAKCKLHHLPHINFDTIDLDEAFSLPTAPHILIANHVLYHTNNPHATLKRIHAQINDNTQCFFATNGVRNMHSLNRFLPARFQNESMQSLIANFTLESGYQHVHEVFGYAQIIRYADGLHITDAAPLISYIESLPWNVSPVEMDGIRNAVNKHLGEYSSLFIEKDTGLIKNTAPFPTLSKN